MTTIQIWQVIAGIGGIVLTIIGGLYAVVTRPILLLMKSENALTRAEIKAEMKDMEYRLNQRIDTHLIHR